MGSVILITSNRFRDTLRILLISPELLVVFATVLLHRTTPDFFVKLAKLVVDGKMVSIATLLGVPIAFVVATYKLGAETLNPQPESTKRLLVNWPDYWKLKARIFCSLVYALISCAGVWVGWYLIDSGSREIGSLICVASYAVGATTVAAVALARLEIRDILAKDY